MKILFTPLANKQTLDAIAYYNEKQRGLGDRFAFELQASIGYISSWPRKSQKRHKTARAVIVNNFPFLVFYELNERQETIVVLSVFNTYQDPKRIKKIIPGKKKRGS